MQSKHSNHYVAIMAGGVGTRFWPISRDKHPKQFLDIVGEGETLLQATYRRFARLVPKENILVVTASTYKNKVLQQLPHMKRENILCEPMRKNTAPCVAYMSFVLQERNKEASLICAPADHYIENEENFLDACQQALDFVSKEQKYLVTMGVQPTYPHTGYGYIQYVTDTLPNETSSILKVKSFTEKPTQELARTFLDDGHFLWNTGLFIVYNTFLIALLKKYARELYDLFNEYRTLLNTQMELHALEKIYPQCIDNSFDYAVMEKTYGEVWVIKANFSWSDLGSWDSAYTLKRTLNERAGNKDENVSSLRHLLSNDAQGNIILSSNEKKLVVLSGLKNYIIADTEDALLICPRHQEQTIKQHIETLKNKKWQDYL